jgi:hypothetical protein
MGQALKPFAALRVIEKKPEIGATREELTESLRAVPVGQLDNTSSIL